MLMPNLQLVSWKLNFNLWPVQNLFCLIKQNFPVGSRLSRLSFTGRFIFPWYFLQISLNTFLHSLLLAASSACFAKLSPNPAYRNLFPCTRGHKQEKWKENAINLTLPFCLSTFLQFPQVFFCLVLFRWYVRAQLKTCSNTWFCSWHAWNVLSFLSFGWNTLPCPPSEKKESEGVSFFSMGYQKYWLFSII